MKEAQMSQNAEQAAIDNAQPVRQPEVKRSFSADAFRALTLRLNEKSAKKTAAPKLVHETVLSPEDTCDDPEKAQDFEFGGENVGAVTDAEADNGVIETASVEESTTQETPVEESSFRKEVADEAPAESFEDVAETKDDIEVQKDPVEQLDPEEAKTEVSDALSEPEVPAEIQIEQTASSSTVDAPNTDDIPVEPPVELYQQPPAYEASQTAQPTVVAGPVVGDVITDAIELEPDVRSGETARALLDMMSTAQPQERALAADTLLHLVSRMKTNDLMVLSKRVCMMDDAPQLLVKALVNHKEPQVAEPLLEDGNVIAEQDLLELIKITSLERLIMIAKGRHLSPAVCEALIARGQASVYLTLVRNPGAHLSHDSFVALCELAKSQPTLQAPLATREDTPPPIAFELFWFLPVELRRYILSRFLTDSATLDKILKLSHSIAKESTGNRKLPSSHHIEELIELIVEGKTDQAASLMTKLSGTNRNNARRIITDVDGEPLTIALKTMGIPRGGFGEAIHKISHSPDAMLRSDRNLSELQIIFDSLSFNKARTLMTYWNWAAEKTGPYKRAVM